VLGDLSVVRPPLVRLHSECLTGDVLGSQRCDCGQQLKLAFQAIGDEGAGVIVYVRGHEGRGIGLLNKLRAYRLQDQGWDTLDANVELGLPEDARSYEQSAAILHDLDVRRLRLLTNNPLKVAALEARGLHVREVVALQAPATVHSAAYLLTKQLRCGHTLGAAG
jgi:3,4-dihydroxy 2-butanone 4-phosphate synthase/GTP cyclohydrolase II